MLARDEQLHLHLVGVAGRNLCAERRLQMVNGASMESATCCGAEFVIGLPTKPKSRLSFFFFWLWWVAGSAAIPTFGLVPAILTARR